MILNELGVAMQSYNKAKHVTGTLENILCISHRADPSEPL